MIDYMRLETSVAYSRDQLRSYRENAEASLAEFLGRWYGPRREEGSDRVPVNIYEKVVSTYLRLLVGGIPQVVVVPKSSPSLAGMALDAETLTNEELARPGFEDVLRQMVFDSFFFPFAIVKTGLQPVGEHPLPDGTTAILGETYCDNILFDDWFQDMTVRDVTKSPYIGHRFRRSTQWGRNNPLFDRQRRELIQPTTKFNFNRNDGRRTEELGVDTAAPGSRDEYEDRTEYLELYFRENNEVVTFELEHLDRPLHEPIPWKGARDGGYTLLYHQKISGNAMPLPPVAVWRDQHDAANTIYRKLLNSAENQKTVMLFRTGSEADAQKIVDAPHMGTVGVEGDPKDFQEVTFNGPDSNLQAMFLQLLDLINIHTGNPDLLGGLAQQADTATQEKMMGQGATARVEAYRDAVEGATGRVVENKMFYYWNDPIRQYQGVREVPHTGYVVPIQITPEMRAGTFERMNFKVVPFSMRRLSAGERLAQIRDVVVNVLVPMGTDPQAILRWFLPLAARYMALPEFNDLLGEIIGQAIDAGPIGQRDRQPPQTTHTSVRRNVPTGGTQQSRRSTMAQALVGQAGNGDQMAALTRGAA